MTTKLEMLLWSLLCGTALGLAGCEEGEPPEDSSADAYGPPADVVEDDAVEDLPGPVDAAYGPPPDY